MDIDRLPDQRSPARDLGACVSVDDAECRAWLERKLDTEFGPCRTITVWPRDAQHQGPDVVVVYHDWREREGDIQMSIGARHPRWCRRQVVDMLLRFPFEFLGCRRITTQVHEANEGSLKLAHGMGFVAEGLLRAYYRDGAGCVVFGMLREDWIASRWNMRRVVH